MEKQEIKTAREIPGVKSNTTILGHTVPTTRSASIVNENKVLEEKVLRRLDMLVSAGDFDQRWLSIAFDKVEEAFMAMNRAIFKPERIQGDL